MKPLDGINTHHNEPLTVLRLKESLERFIKEGFGDLQVFIQSETPNIPQEVGILMVFEVEKNKRIFIIVSPVQG